MFVVQPFLQSSRQRYDGSAIVGESGFRTDAGNENQIKPRRNVILFKPEGFSQQPLNSLAADSIAVLLRDAESDPRLSLRTFVGENEQRVISRPNFAAVDSGEVGGMPESPRLRERELTAHDDGSSLPAPLGGEGFLRYHKSSCLVG